jgi:plastocyanin
MKLIVRCLFRLGLLGLMMIGAIGARASLTNVSVVSYSFNPPAVEINVNDQVKWTWGASFHSTTSDTNLWDSGIQNIGFSFTNTFSSPGTYPYHCTLHGGAPFNMLGSITVVGSANTPILLGSPQRVSATSFEFTYTADPGLTYVVRRSGSLPGWISLSTNTAPGNPVIFIDNAATDAFSLYSVELLPNP